MCPAGTVLDRDQRVDPPEEHSIHTHEVHSQNSLGLGGEDCRQVGPDRRGAGSIPASCRICHTVEAAMRWPSRISSPCTRRCPQLGFSTAMHLGLAPQTDLTHVELHGTPPVRTPPDRCGHQKIVIPWQESRRRSLPSADAARAGTKQPATPGRQACSALGQPVGAARCSRAVRPAARHPCSGLTAPAQRSD
jgi:hypothetical protein